MLNNAPVEESHHYRVELPNLVEDMDLSPYAMRLYIRLKRLCGDHGRCFASERELAEKCYMSRVQVGRELKVLEGRNLITRRTVKRRTETRMVSLWQQNFQHFNRAAKEKRTVLRGLSRSSGDHHGPQGTIPPDPPIRTEEPIKEPVKNTPTLSAQPARARVSEPPSRVCPPQPKPPPKPEHKPVPPSRPSKFSADELREHARRYKLGPGWLTVALRSDRFDAVIDECRARERQQAARISAAPAPDASPSPPVRPPEDPDLAEAQAEYERNRRELEESARVPPAGATEPAETQKPASGQFCAIAEGVTDRPDPPEGAPRKRARRKERRAARASVRARASARAVRAQAAPGDAPDTPAASGDGGRRDGVSGVPRRSDDGARVGRGGALTGPRRHERGPPM